VDIGCLYWALNEQFGEIENRNSYFESSQKKLIVDAMTLLNDVQMSTYLRGKTTWFSSHATSIQHPLRNSKPMTGTKPQLAFLLQP